MIAGTPAYMAPEQLRAGTPDVRTDVFALGVIAYEMLAGDLPFSRGGLADVVLAQDRGAAPLAGLHATIPAALDRAVMRALALEPAARPRSAQAFAAELLAAVAAET
jgi:serine/threonine-protein kinase